MSNDDLDIESVMKMIEENLKKDPKFLEKKFRAMEGEDEVDVYSVPLSSLVEKLSLEEIERREFVSDPLDAAPKKPFGFLFDKWCEFLESVNVTDEVWSFTDRKGSDMSFLKELETQISGYVRVVDGESRDYFVVTTETVLALDQSSKFLSNNR